jgi:hypothetical protein
MSVSRRMVLRAGAQIGVTGAFGLEPSGMSIWASGMFEREVE